MDKILIFLVLTFFACEKNTIDPNQKFVQLKYCYDNALLVRIPYEIVVIDSCEYIHIQNGDASWGTHKGNCKFCAERRNRVKDK